MTDTEKQTVTESFVRIISRKSTMTANDCKGEWLNDCPWPQCACALNSLQEMKNPLFDNEKEPRPTLKNRPRKIEPSQETKESVDAVAELINMTIEQYQKRLNQAFEKAFNDLDKPLLFSLDDIEEIIKNTK